MTGAKIATDFLSRTPMHGADLRRAAKAAGRPQGFPQVTHRTCGVSAPGIHRVVHTTLCADVRQIAKLEAPVNREERAEISRANAALARAAHSEIAEERYQRYCQLRRGGYTIQEGAWELRISRRQAERYEARRKDEV